MPVDTPTASKSAPGFFWVLIAVASFALLSMLAQGLFGKSQGPFEQQPFADAREGDRAAYLNEVKAAQLANVKKMGLEPGASEARLAKSLETLKTLKPGTSTMVVPGSPTQLKQAVAAPAPAAAPAKGATPAAPATPPAK
jgi:hypothetical protein